MLRTYFLQPWFSLSDPGYVGDAVIHFKLHPCWKIDHH